MNANELTDLYHELLPLCRSLTGQGYRDSLKLLQQHLPFETILYHSGSKVLDWTVPPDWTLKRARLWALDESKSHETLVLDTEETALYALNFSEPFSGILSRDELDPHLYSYPAVPDAIPYVTSYYKPRWGLCLNQHQRAALNAPFYRVEIEVDKSSKRPGDGVTVGSYVLPATKQPQQAKTVLISTYLCHSCMLNNELSGPLVQLMLYEKLKAMPERRYNYRFVITPETIGSICYLSDHSAELKSCLEYGMVLTCLAAKHGADDTKLSFKLSRADWVSALKGQASPYAIDRFIRTCAPGIPQLKATGLELSAPASARQAHVRALGAVRPYDLRTFSPNEGSDERQYCSALFNLPVVQASRTVYATYPEYHSSCDNEATFNLQSLFTSADELFAIINYYELCNIDLICMGGGGEPQLGKRNLYPSINSRTNLNMSNDSIMDGHNLLDLIRNELSLSDGSMTLFDQARYLNTPLSDVWAVYNVLADKQLLAPQVAQNAAQNAAQNVPAQAAPHVEPSVAPKA